MLLINGQTNDNAGVAQSQLAQGEAAGSRGGADRDHSQLRRASAQQRGLRARARTRGRRSPDAGSDPAAPIVPTLYDKFVPAEQLDQRRAQGLIGELGHARDWDVYVASVFAPVAKQIEAEDRLSALRDQIERQRDEACARAQAGVGSQRYLGLALLLNSWAAGRGGFEEESVERGHKEQAP
jgi:hypothetical protein